MVVSRSVAMTSPKGCAEVAPSITEELEYLIKGMPLRSLFRSFLVFGELRPEL